MLTDSRLRPFLRRSGTVGLACAVAACGKGAVQFEASRALSAVTNVGTSPMIAIAPSGTLAAAWVSAPEGGQDGRLYLSVNNGPTSELRDSLGPVEIRPESPPKLAFGADGTVDAIYVVAKVVPGFREPRGVLRFVQSRDSGRTWSAPINVTNDGEFGAYDFHAMHVASDGTIYVSWLGGETEKAAAWIARSTDNGATWSPRVRVDAGEACPCCRTALSSASDGTLYMAWRHVFEGDVRDVVVSRSNDHGATWSEPVRVHADGWVFNGCPRAGPALQVDAVGHVHVAWWTGKEKQAGVWYARSDDGGSTFGTPVPLDVANTASPAHVQLGLGGDSAVVATWDDGLQADRRILLRLSRDDGKSFSPVQTLSAKGRSPGYPVIGVGGNQITVAWSEVSKASADSASAMAAEMKKSGSKAPMKLHSVGTTEVMIRRGTLR